MRPKRAIAPEVAVARVAAAQHGVVSLSQLLAAGISSRGVYRRVAAGRLHRLHRGVYAVGHTAISVEGRWLAAVLAAGPGAALGRRSAAALWEMLEMPSGPVDVTVPGSGGRRRRRRITVHRSSTLLPSQVTRRAAIPVTNPARTLDDLKRLLPPDRFAHALRQAELMRLDTGAHSGFEPDLARSELERLFLRLCRAACLPAPELNSKVGPFEVDFLWRDHWLIAEVDGYRYHRSRSAFETDRARDAKLKLFGYEVLRFTYRQLDGDPEGTARTISALLARAKDRVPGP